MTNSWPMSVYQQYLDSLKRERLEALRAIRDGAKFTTPAGAYTNKSGQTISRSRAVVPLVAHRNLSPKSGINPKRVTA